MAGTGAASPSGTAGVTPCEGSDGLGDAWEVDARGDSVGAVRVRNASLSTNTLQEEESRSSKSRLEATASLRPHGTAPWRSPSTEQLGPMWEVRHDQRVRDRCTARLSCVARRWRRTTVTMTLSYTSARRGQGRNPSPRLGFYTVAQRNGVHAMETLSIISIVLVLAMLSLEAARTTRRRVLLDRRQTRNERELPSQFALVACTGILT